MRAPFPPPPPPAERTPSLLANAQRRDQLQTALFRIEHTLLGKAFRTWWAIGSGWVT